MSRPSNLEELQQAITLSAGQMLKGYLIFAFVVFIIVIALAVIVPSTVEWPVSLYLDAEVLHTTSQGWQRGKIYAFFKA